MPGRLLAGQVGKPHGLAGEVYVVPISDDPRRFDPGARLIHEKVGDVIVESSRKHNQRFLIKFEGTDTREAADALRGALYVTPDDLRELDDSEFWEHDLVGCMVVTEDGVEMGEVTAILNGPQDLLEVATAKGERYVPIVREIVVSVDVPARRITVDPPEGLFD
jgi:16S rRNA processing protein RimM